MMISDVAADDNINDDNASPIKEPSSGVADSDSEYVLVSEDMTQQRAFRNMNKHPAQPQYCVICYEREPDRATTEPVTIIQPRCTECKQRRVFYCSLTCLLMEQHQAVLMCHHCKQKQPFRASGNKQECVGSRVTDGGGNSRGTTISPTSLLLVSPFGVLPPPPQLQCSCNWLQLYMGTKWYFLKCSVCKNSTKKIV